MAVHFEFVSALICERILREVDGVTSAIRIVDVFPISDETRSIEFFVVSPSRQFPSRKEMSFESHSRSSIL